MRAYSQRTETMYDSYAALVAAEANGWTVIVNMRTESPNGKEARTFAHGVGPFPDKKTAVRNQARLRRRFRRGLEKVPDTEVVAVTVEPLWKELG